MDWAGVLKGTAASLISLLVVWWCLRRSRAAARRAFNRTVLIDPFVRCTHGGGHVVSRRRAVQDGTTYDGEPIYICHDHRFERKRLLRANEKRPAGGAGLGESR